MEKKNRPRVSITSNSLVQCLGGVLCLGIDQLAVDVCVCEEQTGSASLLVAFPFYGSLVWLDSSYIGPSDVLCYLCVLISLVPLLRGI